MARKIIPARERFEKKVRKDADGCWYWTATRNNQGYGQMRADGKLKLAHRLAYELFCGPIPQGLCVLHSCDNGGQGCVCPSHLWLGTAAENTEDMARKGRSGKRSAAGYAFGVGKRKDRNCARPFRARVTFRNKVYRLGAFATAEEAAIAAQAMKRRLHGLANSSST